MAILLSIRLGLNNHLAMNLLLLLWLGAKDANVGLRLLIITLLWLLLIMRLLLLILLHHDRLLMEDVAATD